MKRILTDSYLYDEKELRTLNGFANQIFDYIDSRNLELKITTELVLDITLGEDGQTVCGYYFIDLETRSVFWLEPFNTRRFCGEIEAQLDEPQISEYKIVMIRENSP